MFEIYLISMLRTLLATITLCLQKAQHSLETLLHQKQANQCPQQTQSRILTAAYIDAQGLETFPPGSNNEVYWRTLISRGRTPTDSLTVGKATLPPLKGLLCPHRHAQAEVYHILSGKGLVTLGNDEHIVAAGDVVYIPGDERHGIRNSSDKEELAWMYYFACDGFEDVKYRF
ncbi:hypothetical protein CAC42_6199 [Sphaceloma murrayae]|uniref:Cupin type-2 domain-containing protein n=1 Tax=Sphaceloma murrayae TaxID=2082308 RepID=A0A2K1QTJ2_9PEZI|nr:hypothetical protein CAC42_6199 [Sphaceloma murrayae]